MNKRTLGQGFEVSAQGLGCMTMSSTYGAADDHEALGTLHTALDVGVTFWDTADIYGLGENEKLLAKVLAERRSEVTLATKFGLSLIPGTFELTVNGRPDYAKACCDASLLRLGTDVIDLYYLHRVDPLIPIEETWGAMSELVEAGKVRHLGLSEASVATITKAHRTYPVTALQSEYSLFTRDIEVEILPVIAELGIGLVPFSPLGRGMLTALVTTREELESGDTRRTNPRFSAEHFEDNLGLVRALERLAIEQRCTPSQLALAWLSGRGPSVVPIPGTKHRTRVIENAAAADMMLDAETVAAIELAVPHTSVAGERYSDSQAALVDEALSGDELL